MNLGRERLDWSQDLWKRIDDAVHDEFQRTGVAAKFIPLSAPVGDALTVASDIIDLDEMTIDEAAVTGLMELWVDFGLTRQQVAGEGQFSTAVTLATRAANLVSQGEDLVIFQGERAFGHELFKHVHHRGGSAGEGLAGAAARVVPVTPVSRKAKKYGEQTFEAVAKAYALLQKQGHSGPYALVLRSELYADSYAPLPETFVMPADRIKPLVPLGYFGTGTLPDSTGVMVSVGGNTIDLVAGVDPVAEFLDIDDAGLYRFRVFERFAVRVKDPTAIVRLEFQ
jgi:uncharacterized linocin/CFP29 family protein